MNEKIKQVQQNFEDALQVANETGDFETLYLKFFSKKHGQVTLLVKELPSLPAEQKKIFGPLVNTLQKALKEKIEAAQAQYEQNLVEDPLIDLTIPVKPKKTGYLHPITQITRELNEFFRYHGFSVYEGPEIEVEEYNFRKLNLPEGHPATDLQDTLYIDSDAGVLLRTHTSSIEARVLSDHKPPIRVAFPGKVFRNEKPSPTNTPLFHQFQGVVVDKGITIQNLKATLTQAHQFLFGDDVVLRFRYKYYPEVSPGLGVDMQCSFCKGAGCDVCKKRGWIEMLGSGMIHYNTLKMCGIDPEVYTGYAFGFGLDRFALQRFGLQDIRPLFDGSIVYKD